MSSLTPAELQRYQRHLHLPQVGERGQLALKAARVLLVGAGGLGSPIALYLAAAGVGTIGLVDGDTVELSNLQRQVLFVDADVGASKAERGAAHLRALNPLIEVRAHPVRITADNAEAIAAGYDLLVDGTDNFPTRYLLSDLAVLTGKPLVSGAIFQFDGQLSVYAAAGGPCYRCVHPEPPAPELAPNCAEAGVLGILPGLVGTLQAAEVIKLILGQGDTLAGRMLLVDVLSMRFTKMRLAKDPACVACGDSPTLTQLEQLPEICAAAVQSPFDMTVEAFELLVAGGEEFALVDVREAYEHEADNLDGQLIPLGQIGARHGELDPSRKTVVYCKMGGRSAKAVGQLRGLGFADVWNLGGGIEAVRAAQILAQA